MKHPKTLSRFSGLAIGFGLLASLFCCLNFCSQAHADDNEPFQMDNGHWMSFERYTDYIKRNRPVGNEALGEVPRKTDESEPGTVEKDVKTTKAAAAATAVEPQPLSEPTVAAPMRPLNLPLLPGISNGMSVQVDSTLNDKALMPVQIVTKDNGESDLHLQEENWQDAADAARKHSEENNASLDADHQPLQVRMSFLPNPKIVPVTQPQRKLRPRIADLPSTPRPPLRRETAEAQKASAECAAIDQYKKEQLQALEGDRKTLQALQAAISDLGLSKELNFMTGANGAKNNAANPITATP